MLKILIVDDNKDFLESCSGFEFENATVYTESQPVDALKRMKELKPNIVITDVMMPGVDGLSFATIVQSILSRVEIIVISANSQKQIEAEYGQLQPEIPYFGKPLGDSFLNYVDGIVSKESLHSSNTDQDYQNIDQKIESTSALVKAYIEWQKCCLKVHTYEGRTIDEYTWENWLVAEGKFNTAMEIMEPGKSTSLLIRSLEMQHGSWAKEVEKTIELPQPINLKFPFRPSWIDSDLDLETLQKVHIQEKNDEFVLVVDGKDYSFLDKREDHTPLMKKMTCYLRSLRAFKELESLFRLEMSEIFSAVTGKGLKKSTSFSFDPPLEMSTINILSPESERFTGPIFDLKVVVEGHDREYEWISEKGTQGKSRWIEVSSLPSKWTILGIQKVQVEIDGNFNAKILIDGETIPEVTKQFEGRLAEKSDAYKVLQHSIEFANHVAQNLPRYWHNGISFDIDSKLLKLDLNPKGFFKKLLSG